MFWENYADLLKYVPEMPVTIPNVIFSEINTKILQDYHDSLDAIVKKYAQNHIADWIKVLT